MTFNRFFFHETSLITVLPAPPQTYLSLDTRNLFDFQFCEPFIYFLKPNLFISNANRVILKEARLRSLQIKIYDSDTKALKPKQSVDVAQKMNSQPKRFGTLTWQPDLVLPHRTFVQITPVTNTPKVRTERLVNNVQLQKMFLS